MTFRILLIFYTADTTNKLIRAPRNMSIKISGSMENSTAARIGFFLPGVHGVLPARVKNQRTSVIRPGNGHEKQRPVLRVIYRRSCSKRNMNSRLCNNDS